MGWIWEWIQWLRDAIGETQNLAGVDKVRGRQGGGRQADLRIFLGVDIPGVDMVTKGVQSRFTKMMKPCDNRIKKYSLKW